MVQPCRDTAFLLSSVFSLPSFPGSIHFNLVKETKIPWLYKLLFLQLFSTQPVETRVHVNYLHSLTSCWVLRPLQPGFCPHFVTHASHAAVSSDSYCKSSRSLSVLSLPLSIWCSHVRSAFWSTPAWHSMTPHIPFPPAILVIISDFFMRFSVHPGNADMAQVSVLVFFLPYTSLSWSHWLPWLQLPSSWWLELLPGHFSISFLPFSSISLCLMCIERSFLGT